MPGTEWKRAVAAVVKRLDERETAIRAAAASSDESLLREIEKLQKRVELVDRDLERRCGRLEKRVGIASHPECPIDTSLEQQMLEMMRRGRDAGRGGDSFAGRPARSERALAFVQWFLDLKGTDDLTFTLGEIKNEITIRGLRP